MLVLSGVKSHTKIEDKMPARVTHCSVHDIRFLLTIQQLMWCCMLTTGPMVTA